MSNETQVTVSDWCEATFGTVSPLNARVAPAPTRKWRNYSRSHCGRQPSQSGGNGRRGHHLLPPGNEDGRSLMAEIDKKMTISRKASGTSTAAGMGITFAR